MTFPEVIDCHLAHPDWCAKEIAAHLNCSYGYVRSLSARKSILLPSAFERRRQGIDTGQLQVKR